MAALSPQVLRSALHNAISAGSVADVRLCVERGGSLEWRDPEERACGMTALQLAVCSSAPLEAKVSVIEYLLQEQKVDIEAIDYVESTALHMAAALGDAPTLLVLLKGGASPRATDAEGLTPLHLAVNGGHLATVAALTDNYAPLDATDWEEEDIDSDPKFGDDEASRERNRREGGRRVAAQGASLYVARRGTPLHGAARLRGHLGPSYRSNSPTPARAQSIYSRLTLSSSPPPRAPPPMSVAAASNRLAIAKHLLSVGAPVNNREGPQSSTPLHIAARGGLLDMVGVLLAAGADREARDELGETPLMRAVEGGSLPVAQVRTEFSRAALSGNG